MYSNGNIEVRNEKRLLDDSTKGIPLTLQMCDSSDAQFHQQQTTRKITTVTKVVHEVQHLPTREPVIDFMAIPYKSAKLNGDNSNMEFPKVGGVGSQLLYGETTAKTHTEDVSTGCIAKGSDVVSHFTSVEELEYPNHYISNSPAVNVPRGASQYNFSVDASSCSLSGSQDPITNSSHNLHLSMLAEHSMAQNNFLQSSQFPQCSEYGGTPEDPHYVKDPAVAYGCVSDTNFALTTNNLSTNSCSSHQIIFGEDVDGPGSLISSDTNSRPFESHIDLQNKMVRLAITSIDVSHMRGHRESLVETTESEICSNLRWRDPNLAEVISFLNSPSNTIKANAAAYLQHLCYMDDTNKQRTRNLGGIPLLVRLLAYDVPNIHKNACGALRNLSYGRQNDENKRAIKDAGGVISLVSLLCRTHDSEIRELVTGVLWNMSSCEDIKRTIIDEGLAAIANNIIKPHSGWDPVCSGDTCFSTVFKNSSGVLRNISSAGEYARTKLRNSDNLVECLVYVIKMAIERNNIGNKTVENCVCILRNLSYRCQEIEDPHYDKHPLLPSRLSSNVKGDNLGCFGTNRKKKGSSPTEYSDSLLSNSALKNGFVCCELSKNFELLWQPEVVQYYLALLQTCSNPETLEAAAGAIQNLSACYWEPSIDIRATVRKEKGLPVLVELLRMEVDRVVCAVATALRNLAIDQRNKELIGKYAMRDLVQKLPSGNAQHDQNTSDETISAVLATINEVIKKNPEFSRSLLDAGGVERLMNITCSRQKFSSCVLKFASQVLFTMWQHNELRDVYKKNGWKEQDFVSKSMASQNASPHSPSNINNTLNRPMASQGRTRYEDRTIQRTPASRTIHMGHKTLKEDSIFAQTISPESSIEVTTPVAPIF